MAHTPKPADVAVSTDPLLRAAPSNHTLTAVSQFPCNIPPTYPIRDGEGIAGTADAIYRHIFKRRTRGTGRTSTIYSTHVIRIAGQEKYQNFLAIIDKVRREMPTMYLTTHIIIFHSRDAKIITSAKVALVAPSVPAQIPKITEQDFIK